MRRLLLLLSVPIMIGLATTAHADPDSYDAAFLSSLRQAGITYQNPDQAVAAGKTVCDLMSNGKSGPEVVQQLKNANPGFTVEGATRFTGIAANAYCPQQLTSGSDGSAKQP